MVVAAFRYDNWGKLIRIEELGLKAPLRIELELPTDYDNPQVRHGPCSPVVILLE